MSGVNKVIVVGRLGKDAEVRYTKDGTGVANFDLAVGETWKDRDGTKQEKTEWIRCVAWGKLSEIVKEYTQKGSQIYVEGKLQTRSWENKQGQKQYTTEVNVQNLQLLGSKTESHGADRGPTPEPEGTFQATDDDVPF